MPDLPLITVQPIDNIDPSVFMNLTASEWDALMEQKYGIQGEDNADSKTVCKTMDAGKGRRVDGLLRARS